MSDYGMIIDGQKIYTENTFSVLNPANEEVLAECPIATREHLDQAVEAASKAFESWSKVSDEKRAAVCGKISDAIASHSEELAKLLTQEQGKPPGRSGFSFRARRRCGLGRIYQHT